MQNTNTDNTSMIDKSKFLFGKGLNLPSISFFQHNSALEDEKVEYIWCKDKKHIRQYIKLVNENFDDELNIPGSYKKIDLKDLNSHFFIALKNMIVMGGARFSVNDKFYEYSLPNEKLGLLKYKELFPELDLENNSYGEVTKYVALPEYRNDMSHYLNAFKGFKELSDELRVKYMFICSTKSRARLYNLGARKFFKVLEGKNVVNDAWKELSHFDVYVSVYENKNI
jgi:hypothetical protein